MKPQLLPDTISLSTIKRVLVKYDDYVPGRLAELEEQRLLTIPNAISTRGGAEGAYIEEDELKSLVEWKLYGISPYFCSPRLCI